MSDPNNLEGDPPTAEERAAMARELDEVAPTPGDKFALMFGLRPTPRTDALKAEYLKSTPVPWTALKACETLERELAEARAQLESWQKLALSAEVLRKKAETEQDNAESDRKQAEADTLRALHERNEAREQLETERMRLAAVGVVALADTVESRDRARDMLPEYRSASLSDVERRVDECIALREQRDRVAPALRNLRDCIQETRGKDAREAVEQADEALTLHSASTSPVIE